MYNFNNVTSLPDPNTNNAVRLKFMDKLYVKKKYIDLRNIEDDVSVLKKLTRDGISTISITVTREEITE